MRKKSSKPTLESFKKWIEEFMATPAQKPPTLIPVPFVEGKWYRKFKFSEQEIWMPLKEGIERNDEDRMCGNSETGDFAYQWHFSQ